MSHFFNIFEKFTKNKTKNVQRNTDEIFKYIYNEFLVSERVYNKTYKKFLKKEVKEIKNKSDIPYTDLLDGIYIDKIIKEKIFKESLYLLHFSLKLQGVDININLLLFNDDDFNNLKKYDTYINNIFILLKFLFFFTGKNKPSTLDYYLYLTDHKKVMPKKNDIISPINCNTGITYGCSKNGKVLIYRKEEWFKVLIHESFHLFCLDFNNLPIENIKRKMKNMINIKSDFLLFESYTENWTTIIHSIFCAIQMDKKDKSSGNFLLYLDFILTYEKIFSLFQCVKVLDHMGLKYKNLIGNSELDKSLKNLYYKEKSNVFAYYIVKMVLLYNKEEFLLWCKKNNKDNILNFTKNEESLNIFFEFLKKKMMDNTLKKDIELIEKLYKKKKNKNLLKSLRMTITNIE